MTPSRSKLLITLGGNRKATSTLNTRRTASPYPEDASVSLYHLPTSLVSYIVVTP